MALEQSMKALKRIRDQIDFALSDIESMEDSQAAISHAEIAYRDLGEILPKLRQR